MKQDAVVMARPGEWHRVRCILIPEGWYSSRALWWPVLGPPHRDPEIGADWMHIHIDWRFVPDKLYRHHVQGSTGKPHGSVVSSPFKPECTPDGPVFRVQRRKCWREMPDFPRRFAGGFEKLERSWAERCAKLTNGTHCPHRGIDLRPFTGPDGTAVCPGHGLRWDMRTGELLRHHRPTIELAAAGPVEARS